MFAVHRRVQQRQPCMVARACRHVTCAVCPPASPPRPNPENQRNQPTRPPLASPLSLPHPLPLPAAHSSDLSPRRTPGHQHTRSAPQPRRGIQRPMARTRALGGRLLLLAVLATLLALQHAPAPCAAWSALPASTISAAPEYPPLPRLPRHHHHSALPPAAQGLSPDIMPVLPSPAEDGAAAPPSDAEPIIPSSPSPPNPDALEPNSAYAPSGYAPAVAAQSPAPPPVRAATVAWALPVVVALLAMWSV